MRAFTIETGVMVPLNRSNVDTDAIIPKQFLKSIKRSGFGVNLFDQWRYLDEGQPGMDNSKRPINPNFVLNNPIYKNAKVLLTRDNFGCGSSREHAVWALDDYGFRTVIAPSFADIFCNNCFKNGVLPVALAEDEVDTLFDLAENKAVEVTIDLDKQTVNAGDNYYHFSVDTFRKDCLLKGLDAIGLTLQYADDIKAFEAKYQKDCPWIFEETVI
ncbi:MAG: 3-isopropylmalate dehydratase small subunit [Ostreibacterium sp.]